MNQQPLPLPIEQPTIRTLLHAQLDGELLLGASFVSL
jgi:hypothetical protein